MKVEISRVMETSASTVVGWLGLHRIFEARQVFEWRRAGCPAPPPTVVKERVVVTHARRFGIKTLVETGTLGGDMVNVTRRVFAQVYSIELDKELFEKARERFAAYPHIRIIHGDSRVALRDLLGEIAAPCVFWLDAHFSGGGTARGLTDTPVRDEILAILDHSCDRHVVLIDDARLFDGTNGYPTIVEVEGLFGRRRPGWTFEVRHDIIRACPLLG